MLHRSQAAKGLAALGATLAFVVGLPLALALVVGNPLPTSIPTWDALRVASTVESEVVVNALAILLWAVWARGTLALAVEAIAAWRGRALQPNPASMGPRAIAARAIASITLLTVLLPGRVALAAPLSASVQPAPMVATAAVEDRSAPAAAPLAPSVPAPEPSAAGTYSVGARDTWWSVAEAALDDGLRWREVRDLNVGRTMADGHVVTSTDEQLVEGWKVLVPGTAAAVSTSAEPPAAGEVLVAPGDTLWHIAEHELGDPFAWPEVFAANASVAQPDGGSLEDPDLIQPGWRLSIADEGTVAPGRAAQASPAQGSPSVEAPATEAPVPGQADGAIAPAKAGEPTPTTVAPRRERPLRAPGRTAPAQAGGEGVSASDQPAPAQVGLGGLAAAAAAKVAMIGVPALAATGVVVRLGLLRRRQLRRRRPHRSLPHPDPALEPLERHLRAIAAEEVAEWVELTLRLLTMRIAEHGYDVVPQVLVLQAGQFGVEVLLNQPCAPPGDFEAVDDPRVWRLSTDVELDELRELVAGAPVISPALVSLGGAPEGPVLVDLETLGVLSVEGDEHRVRGFLAGVALQLATASWSEIELAVIEGDLGVPPLERGPACADADELVERVATRARATASALGDWVSTTTARVAEADADAWAPVVAVVGPDRQEEVVARLTRVVGLPGQGGALVAAGPIRDATWRLSISAAGKAVLAPLGLEVDISGVDYETVADVSCLLEVAAEEGDNAPLVDLVAESARHQAPAEVLPAPGEEDLAASQQRLLEAPTLSDVVVRVLGRPEVSGWNSPASRKASEIVVYLATHDGPVPTDQLRGAMWPMGDARFNPTAAKGQTMKSAMHRTRVALGFDGEGQAHLPPSKDAAYRLGPNVRCDWSEFRLSVAQAQRQPRDEAVASLRSALELVRGAPFSYVGDDTYGWASSELIASDMEVAIGDAAHRLCQLALSQGDDVLAMWATRQGLLASPGQEALYRERMDAAAASGDPARLRAVLQDAQGALRSIDPLDELQEETVAYFDEAMSTLQRRRA